MAPPFQISLRTRKGATGIGACTYSCLDTGRDQRDHRKGPRSWSRPLEVSSFLGALPWRGDSGVGFANTPEDNLLAFRARSEERLPSLDLIIVLTGKGVWPCTPECPSLSMATIPCTLPYSRGQMCFKGKSAWFSPREDE